MKSVVTSLRTWRIQLLLLVAVSLAACNPMDGAMVPPDTVVGYLYTTTNGEGTNQVIRFARHEDGSLSDETAFSTESLGGADTSAGGPAAGDFDSEGALKIVGDYLLTVNAGGNTISVFSLDRTNGDISLLGNTDSMGTRPVSITTYPIADSSTEFWLVVGNQWNNPNVQGNPGNIMRFPNDAFFMQDLTQPDPTDQERNLHLFRFNTADGSLTSVSQLDTFVRENGGPVAVNFSPDGSKLAVTLWGIAHFGADMPSLDELHPSRVYVYDFDNNKGTVSNPRFFEEEGIAGTIGFKWAPDSNTTLIVSNFNTTLAKTDNSVTVLSDDGKSVAKVQNFVSGDPDDLDEACWVQLSPGGDRVYVASFSGNVITPYTLDGTGEISATLPFETRQGFAPVGDSKEMYITPDNKYLYNTGALQSFSVVIFDITADGVDWREQVTLKTTQAAVGQIGVYNFLGLDGFDK